MYLYAILEELTGKIEYDTMKKQHESINTTDINVEPKDGGSELSCCYESGTLPPSLDLTNKEKSTDELLDELADIFVESIIWELEYGKQAE